MFELSSFGGTQPKTKAGYGMLDMEEDEDEETITDRKMREATKRDASFPLTNFAPPKNSMRPEKKKTSGQQNEADVTGDALSREIEMIANQADSDEAITQTGYGAVGKQPQSYSEDWS